MEEEHFFKLFHNLILIPEPTDFLCHLAAGGLQHELAAVVVDQFDALPELVDPEPERPVGADPDGGDDDAVAEALGQVLLGQGFLLAASHPEMSRQGFDFKS